MNVLWIHARTQAGGDYDEQLVLRPDLAPGRTGPEVHRRA